MSRSLRWKWKSACFAQRVQKTKSMCNVEQQVAARMMMIAKVMLYEMGNFYVGWDELVKLLEHDFSIK